MTKIDFHILPSDQLTQRLIYTARLCQKALDHNHQILIAVENQEHSEALSQSLWSFRAESFLAHSQIETPHHQLQISHNGDCGAHHDILINLCQDIPTYFSRFQRVFEVVIQEPDMLKSSRTRYRFYQDRGYALSRHDLRDRVSQ